VQQVTFAPAENPVTWVFATLDWGSDAYAALAPTPP
jgi:hypothetical protein